MDIASMSTTHDDDQQHVVLDGVDDSVVADTDTKPGTTLPRAGPRWSRVLGQQSDHAPAFPVPIVIGPRDGATEAFERASASGATWSTRAAAAAAAGLLKDLPA